MRPRTPPIAADGLVILYEDNHLLVVDKPAGLLTQPARAGDDSLLERARASVKARHDKPGNVFLGLVHRLDRNVGGVVVFARTSKAASRLAEAFRARRVTKSYLAVVEGVTAPTMALEHRLLERDGGVVVGAEGATEGKLARLDFERLAACPEASLVRVALHTGRKHQIRAQLAAAGHPIVGDPRYGHRSARINRPALHAERLGVPHPVGGAPLEFTAPPPADLRALLGQLGLPVSNPWS